MKTSLQRARWLLRGALFLVLAPLCGPGVGRAQVAETRAEPWLEMKAAAEAMADVDPEPALPPRSDVARTGQPGAGRAKEAAADSAPHAARAELHDAVRSAVREEIQQEVRGVGHGPSQPGTAAVRRGAQGESARSDAARANDAASQAQQARLNREVSRSREKSQGKPLVTPPASATGRP
ncbi:MAG: hypothetical protein U1A78_38345 [Polyangia bacterium]